MPTHIHEQHPAEQIIPATSFSKLAVGPVAPPTRAIYVAEAGTVTWTDDEGHTEVDVPLVAGLVLSIAIINIAAIDGATLYGLK